MAHTFPGAACGVPAHSDSEPIACPGTNAALPVARLLAGLRDTDGSGDAVDARYNGSIGTLEGGEETAAATDAGVSPAAR